MLKKLLLSGFVMSLSVAAFSQDSTKPFSTTISGAVDAYTRYNFSDPKNGNLNNYTSFTNSQNSFELGMANIKVDNSFGKASGTIDIALGRRGEEFSYADVNHGSLFSLKQAYLTYAVSNKLKFTMGKWATHIGYELVDAYLNRNYSMSYMFSYGPFSHTGVKADISLGGKSGLMLGVANTTDYVSTTSSRRFLLGQFSTASKNDKVKAYLNYQGSFGGAYALNQVDLVLTGTITDKFSIGYNGTIQNVKPSVGSSNSWWGSALYLNVDPTSIFGVTLRGEYFHNEKSVSAAPGTNIFDVTLSPNFKINNLTIIPELRFENAKDAIFLKGDNSITKSTTSAILAAVYHF